MKKILIALSMLAACLVPLGLGVQSASALTCSSFDTYHAYNVYTPQGTNGYRADSWVKYRTCNTSAGDALTQVERIGVDIDPLVSCGLVTGWTANPSPLNGTNGGVKSKSCGNPTSFAWIFVNNIDIYPSTSTQNSCFNIHLTADVIGVVNDPDYNTRLICFYE